MARMKRISYDLIDSYILGVLAGDSSEVRGRVVRELLCGGLTERQRDYLLLRYAKNMNGSQIARLYGVSRSTVSVTLSRARKRITKLLGTQKLREDFSEYISEL